MKRTKRLSILHVSLSLVITLTCSSCQGPASPPEASVTPSSTDHSTAMPILSTVEYLCLDFVTTKLTQNGAIRTNYLDFPFTPDYATGEEILSESQGLFMLYAAQTYNQALFDSAYNLVLTTLDNGTTISYRYTPSKEEAYSVNAAVDDLRIINSLLLASNTFEDSSYKEKALFLADRFYDTNIHHYQLYDFYDIKNSCTNDFITLCYVDFSTLNQLGNHQKKWNKVSSKMLKLVKAGYINDTFPLYYPRYSYSTNTYESVETINMIESLLTACHLSEINECPKSTLIYLKNLIKGGAIYSSYYLDGTPATDIESTAVYALCAQLGAYNQDAELYHSSINKMNQFQIQDASSPIYGAFGNVNTHEAFSFDNLMALMAYRIGDKL